MMWLSECKWCEYILTQMLVNIRRYLLSFRMRRANICTSQQKKRKTTEILSFLTVLTITNPNAKSLGMPEWLISDSRKQTHWPWFYFSLSAVCYAFCCFRVSRAFRHEADGVAVGVCMWVCQMFRCCMVHQMQNAHVFAWNDRIKHSTAQTE